MMMMMMMCPFKKKTSGYSCFILQIQITFVGKHCRCSRVCCKKCKKKPFPCHSEARRHGTGAGAVRACTGRPGPPPGEDSDRVPALRAYRPRLEGNFIRTSFTRAAAGGIARRRGNPSRAQARPEPPLHSRTRSSLQRAGRHCRPHFASHRESSSEGSSVMKPSTSPAGLGKCPAGGVRLVSDGCAGRSASAK